MNAQDISEKLQTIGFSINIQGDQVYAHIDQEVRISQIYIILEGKIPYSSIEKVSDRTFRISGAESQS